MALALTHLQSYNSITTADLSRFYTQESGSFAGGATEITTDVDSNNVLKLASGQDIRLDTGSTETYTIVGKFRFSALPSSDFTFMETRQITGNFPAVSFVLKTDGFLKVTRGTGGGLFTLISATSAGITAGLLHRLELRLKQADAGGSVTVLLDGVSVGTFGGDTFTNAGEDLMILAANGTAIDIEHLGVFTSASAETPKSVGQTDCTTLRPNGDSTPSEWTPSTGSTSWEILDRVTPDTASNINSDTDAQQDYCDIENLPAAVTTVHGVGHSLYLDKDAAGAIVVKSALKSGASEDIDGTGFAAVQNNPLIFVRYVEVDPDSGIAFTTADINGLKIGVQSGIT